MAQEVKGYSIELSLNTTEFKKNMNDITNNLKDYQKNLTAINKVISSQPDNIENWRRKQDTLNKIIEETRKKQDLLNKELQEATAQLASGKISQNEFNKLQRDVDYCTASLNKYNNELDKTNNKIVELSSHSKTFEEIGSKLTSVGSKLTKGLTVPIVSATTAVVGLTTALANSIDEMNDTASKAGLSVEAYQEWAYAAEILAVDSNQLYKAFVKTNSLLGDISSGRANSATEALEGIGLSINKLKGKSTEEAFEIIRDALSKVEDQAKRTDVANQIFGDRLGSELAQILGATTEQIEALKDEANELGIATTEQANLAGDFNDELLRLKLSFQGVGYELMEQLLPVMKELAENIRENLVPKIQELITWWNNLGENQQETILKIAGVVVALGPVTQILGTTVSLVGNLSQGFKLLKTNIAGLVTSLGPIGVAISAIVAVLAVMYTQSEDLKEVINDFISTLGELLEPIMEIVDVLIDSLEPVLEALFEIIGMLGDLLAPILKTILEPLKAQLRLLANILEAIAPLLETIASVFNLISPFLNMITDLLQPIIDFLNQLSEALSDVINKFTELFTLDGSSSNWFDDLLDNFQDWWKDIFNMDDLPPLAFEQTGTYSTTNHNTVNVYTTSSTFDIDSINDALGGKLV